MRASSTSGPESFSQNSVPAARPFCCEKPEKLNRLKLPEHPIAMARLKEHLEHFGEPPSFDLVFVVPQNIFGEFRYQKYHTTGNRPATSIDKAMSKVKQWVLELPVRDDRRGRAL